MPSATTVLSFCLAALAVLLVPGPSVAFVVACSIQHGRMAGLASVLGLELGALLHVAGAALGLGTLLASSHELFQAVRYAGAAYLVVLGVRTLRKRTMEDGGPKHRAAASSRWRLVRDGIFVDLLNPKTALFFVAFLPQFVRPAEGSGPAQILVLGGCFVVLAAGCDATYAIAASGLAERVRGSHSARRRIRQTTGGVYFGLAGLAVFT
jgi:threonine/homoserine/homoserine lactone efflux protein